MDEEQSFEAILERMLARVPNSLDKREGSIIYDALAPAAAEMAQMYMELELNTNLHFADTADGEYLDRCIAWLGIKRRAASKAELRGVFSNNKGEPQEVPVGSRFSIEMLNYTATQKLSAGVYRLECETAGAVAIVILDPCCRLIIFKALPKGKSPNCLFLGRMLRTMRRCASGIGMLHAVPPPAGISITMWNGRCRLRGSEGRESFRYGPVPRR